jgi:hypothetical protein
MEFRPTRTWIPVTTLIVAVAIGTSSCGGSSPKSATSSSTSASESTATLPPVTTTTVDPGTLPQTDAKPTATGESFDVRMKALADAIVADDPSIGLPAFFPVEAYKQTKKNTDPAGDWKNRLIANFKVDVADANRKLGPNAKNAVFKGVDVPDTAVWVKPGEEYNVGPYWRVYKAQMNFLVDGKAVQIPIEAMISWRGQWYVVHLGAIR